MSEDYGDAERGIKKSLNRDKKRHKEQTGQTAVRYTTLRAGQSLIVKMAQASVKKPSKKGKKPKAAK